MTELQYILPNVFIVRGGLMVLRCLTRSRF